MLCSRQPTSFDAPHDSSRRGAPSFLPLQRASLCLGVPPPWSWTRPRRAPRASRSWQTHPSNFSDNCSVKRSRPMLQQSHGAIRPSFSPVASHRSRHRQRKWSRSIRSSGSPHRSVRTTAPSSRPLTQHPFFRSGYRPRIDRRSMPSWTSRPHSPVMGFRDPTVPSDL